MLTEAQSTIMQTRKQTKHGFLENKSLLPLGIYIFPKNFSLYESARDRISPPENVYKSHIEMTIFSDILSNIKCKLELVISR